jgi:chromosome segregation ATPase
MPKKVETPEATEDTEVVDPQETPVQPETNWEDRFKGLQRTFQKTQKKLEELEEKEGTLLEEVETTKQSERQRQAALDALQAEKDKAQAELDRVNGELATQETKILRSQVIMRDFPDLSEFEVNGLLPQADNEEDMVEKFTKFRSSVQSLVKVSVEKQVTGSSPSETVPSDKTPTRTKAEIYTQLQNLAGRRDPDSRVKYKELLDEWDELNK